MLKYVMLVSALLISLSASAQEATQSSQPCTTLKVAFDKNPKWFAELQSFCGGNVILGDHGFDFGCLALTKNIVLLPKSKMERGTYILIYSIQEVGEEIIVQFVRTSNGKPNQMETVAIRK